MAKTSWKSQSRTYSTTYILLTIATKFLDMLVLTGYCLRLPINILSVIIQHSGNMNINWKYLRFVLHLSMIITLVFLTCKAFIKLFQKDTRLSYSTEVSSVGSDKNVGKIFKSKSPNEFALHRIP